MSTFKRARGACPKCGREVSARVSDKRKEVDVTCAGCGDAFALPVDPDWWISYSDERGRPRVKRIGPSARLAAEAEQAIRADRLRGELKIGRRGPSLTLVEALGRYSAEISVRVKPKPYVDRINCLRRIIGRIGDLRLDQLDESTFEEYRTRRLREGTMPGTVATELARIKALLGWCVRQKLLASRPAIKVVQPDNGRLRFLTREEAGRLLAGAEQINQTLRDYIELLLYTGLRRSEGLSLRWAWVDLERRAIDLPAEACKSGHGRTVPLAAPVVEMLRRRRSEVPAERVFFLDGKPMTDCMFEYGFGKARKLAGLGADVTLHTLRHTCASWLVQAGVDLFTVGQVLGHRNPMVTKRYAHLAPEHLLSAVDRLSPVTPGPAGGEKASGCYQDVTGKKLIRFPIEKVGHF